jgi:phosphate transport system protein
MRELIALSARVEESMRRAVQSLQERDIDKARLVEKDDEIIDAKEIDIEEECLKIFALHQPVAIDLRYLVAALKINNDLERIGDEAVNIAERSLRVSPLTLPGLTVDFAPLCAQVQEALRNCLDALVHLDAGLAHKVRLSDDRIDEMVHVMFVGLKNEIKKYPEQTDQLVEYLRVSRHLERIADHATNIAEDVIYMIEGSIVRHRQETP